METEIENSPVLNHLFAVYAAMDELHNQCEEIAMEEGNDFAQEHWADNDGYALERAYKVAVFYAGWNRLFD